MSTSFSWLSGRRLRIALVEALECINDTPLYDIISGMNAWTDMATDTPNFSRRQESFDTAEKYILNDSFDLLGHALIFYNCVFNVTRVRVICFYIVNPVGKLQCHFINQVSCNYNRKMIWV